MISDFLHVLDHTVSPWRNNIASLGLGWNIKLTRKGWLSQMALPVALSSLISLTSSFFPRGASFYFVSTACTISFPFSADHHCFSLRLGLLFHVSVPAGPDLKLLSPHAAWGVPWHQLSLWTECVTGTQIPLTFICGCYSKVIDPKLTIFLPSLSHLSPPPSFDNCFSICLATRLGISASTLILPSSLPLIISQWPCHINLISEWLRNRVLEPEVTSLRGWT